MIQSPILTAIKQHIELTDDEQELLMQHVSKRKYLKGQFVLQQGDVCNYETMVISGCLKTYYINEEGHEHILRFSLENWWAADLGSFINQQPANFNIQCLENTEVHQISFVNMQKLYAQIPKLERFFRIRIEKGFAESEARIIRSLSLTATEKYVKFRERYPQIEQRIPQYMIASYLGMTKEFLSKLRSQLIANQ
jgi:CRP-like cAMP-binding protein